MLRAFHNRHFTAALGLMTALLLLLAMAAPAVAVKGNNGTVKIHDGASEAEPIIQNEPHVCDFHLHFFFSDAGQTGDWWIQSWPPTGDKTTVLLGTYLSDATGEYRDPAVGTHSLPNGHYKLFWMGRNDNNIKHKVFWVDCEPTEPPPGECTWFFASAPVGTLFFENDTHLGGTFTEIENDWRMKVRLESDGNIVGRFPSVKKVTLGDSATITFGGSIHIEKILWHDNDPKAGETGWSFNGIAGPLTGNQLSVLQDVDLTTGAVNIDAGGDSGGIDFCFTEVQAPE
jgi:hypothetical protein